MTDPTTKHEDPPHPDPQSHDESKENNKNNYKHNQNQNTKNDDIKHKKKNKISIDTSKLKLNLNNIENSTNTKIKYPLSAPSRLNMKSPRRKPKTSPNPLNTARARKQESQLDKLCEDGYKFKRIIPYTPRLDELPLSLRLHSNPMILLQSLRRQKVSNYNMYHTEPAIDNKPDKHLKMYAERRKKWRENESAFPSMPPLPNQIPKFVAKQFKYEFMMNYTKNMKQHKFRCNNMTPHIDNKLPKHIESYRKMRRDRLKNAQKKAKKLHEKRLKSPPNKLSKAPKPPTRRLPPSTKQRISQIRRDRLKKVQQKNKPNKKLQIEASNAAAIMYVDERKARISKYLPSPKKLLTPDGLKKRLVVQALPCHFDEWKK